ncbi:hypothetical protein [Klebsiella pneumoniae]|uniref:hypothetical protein n=1 Tax=Klebsiella pneumoniae TaxID=573 RepID=UPI0039BEC9A2
MLSNLQKLKSAVGLPLVVSVSRKSFLGATVGLPAQDLGPADPCGGTSRDRQWR